MDPSIASLLRSPGKLLPLQVNGDALQAANGQRFAVEDGIPRLINKSSHTGWQHFYDWAAFAYDATLHLGTRLRLGSEERIHSELLAAINQPAGSLVLDVGCGTGAARAAFTADIRYLGLDLSLQMLRRAQRKCAQLDLPAELAQADAHELPLVSRSADLVVTMGIVQHLHSPHIAIQELARVLKTHGKLLIIDESRTLHAIAKKLLGSKVGLEQLSRWISNTFEISVNNTYLVGEYFCLEFVKYS